MGDKAYTDSHKALGLCIKCSAKATIRGFCATHYYSQLQSDRHYHDRNFIERNKVKAQRKASYKEKGRCTDCGIKLLEDEGVRCVNCKSGAERRI